MLPTSLLILRMLWNVLYQWDKVQIGTFQGGRNDAYQRQILLCWQFVSDLV